MKNLLFKSILLAFAGILISNELKAQFLMDMIDTTKDIGKGVLSLYQRFDHIKISGYIQPQFQYIQEKGAKSYSGGDFLPNVNSRFMLRRGRIRFDYAYFNKKNQPTVQFVFQFDGTERGVFIRDFWGRVYENKFQLFSLSSGMFARPFGYEVNLSSSDRESPERGRMSQILMKTERDLGAMVSLEPRRKDHPLRFLKLDAGFFNGQGLTFSADYDSYKDFITRVSLKPYPLQKNLSLSAGLSYLNGGLLQNSKYIYTTQQTNNGPAFVVDSSASNFGAKAPRIYYGADVQLKMKHKKAVTEIRAEYWQGKQTAGANTTETPVLLPLTNEAYYIRNFNGAFFYVLHTINNKHQIGVKYDWYDPNTKVNGTDIGKAGNNINAANIKYNTLGFGYTNFINSNLKVVFWYDIVKNENTQLAGYTSDLKDNIFTCRMQFRF